MTSCSCPICASKKVEVLEEKLFYCRGCKEFLIILDRDLEPYLTHKRVEPIVQTVGG